MVQRNLLVYKHGWMVIFSGFFEPLFYLLSIGIGLGAMVPDVGGISYAAFVAPGLLASSCHERRDHRRLLQHLLQAALPEDLRRHPGDADARAGRGVRRDAVGAHARLDLRRRPSCWWCSRSANCDGPRMLLSPWALLAFPAAVLVAASFSAMALCVTSFVRKIEDFDIVMGLLVMPMFLFSGIFFPVSQLPGGVSSGCSRSCRSSTRSSCCAR